MNCTRIEEYFPDVVDRWEARIPFGLLYSTAIFLGVVGNVFTLWIVWVKGVWLGVHYPLIVNLSCSDLLMSLTSVPVTGLQIFSRVWVFGGTACQIVPLLQGTSLFVSSFTLAAIGVDRWRAMSELRRCTVVSEKERERRQRWLGLAIWLIGSVLALPHALVMRITTSQWRDPQSQSTTRICGSFCEEDWRGQAGVRAVYGTIVFCGQFLLPCILLCACYFWFWRRVSTTLDRRQSMGSTSLLRLSTVGSGRSCGGEAERRSAQRQVSLKRTLRIVTFLCLAFVLSWLPLNALNLLRDFQLLEVGLAEEWLNIVYAVCHLVAMFSVVWNPIIYCWLNSEFQAQLARVCKPCALHQAGRALAEQGPKDDASQLSPTIGPNSFSPQSPRETLSPVLSA